MKESCDLDQDAGAFAFMMTVLLIANLRFFIAPILVGPVFINCSLLDFSLHYRILMLFS